MTRRPPPAFDLQMDPPMPRNSNPPPPPASNFDRVPALLEGGPRDGEGYRAWAHVQTFEVAYAPDRQDCDRMICSGWYRPDPDRPGIWTWRGHAPHPAPIELPPLRWWTRVAHAWQAAVIEFVDSWRRSRP